MKTECRQNRFKQADIKSFRSIKLEQYIKLRPTSCSAPTCSRLKCCQTSARRRMQKVGISKKIANQNFAILFSRCGRANEQTNGRSVIDILSMCY